MAELARRTLGGVFLFEVDADPDGGITAPKSSLALDSTNGLAYQNTDGSTTWVELGTGAAGAGTGAEPISVQTTDATVTTMASRTIAATSVETVTATVDCRDTGGTLRASFVRTVRVYREGGSAVLGIVQDDYTDKSDPGLDCTFDVSGNDLRVRVTGKAVTTIDWDGSLSRSSVKTTHIYQVVSKIDNTRSTTTTTIPNDNSVPTITEGAQWTTQAITPVSATSLLKIEASLYVENTTNVVLALAVYNNANTCIGIVADVADSALSPLTLSLLVPGYAHGSASAQTFKFRAGPTGGTMTINGINNTDRYGGVIASSVSITEYENF